MHHALALCHAVTSCLPTCRQWSAGAQHFGSGLRSPHTEWRSPSPWPALGCGTADDAAVCHVSQCQAPQASLCMRQPRTAHWFPAGHAAQQGGSLANGSTLALTGSTPGSTAARLTISLSSTGIERDLVCMRHAWLARGQRNPAQAVRHPSPHHKTACRPEAAATNTIL